MGPRKLNTARLYKLIKTLVLIISVISLILGAYWLYLVKSGAIIHPWEKMCASGDWGTDCMSIGYDHEMEVANSAFRALGIGVGLPIIFFGVSFLFRYLFPKKK